MATKKKTSKKKKKKATMARAPHGTGIVKSIEEMLRTEKTNEEILSSVKKKFPKAKTNLACVSWVRTKLRKDGEKIKTNRELIAAGKLPVNVSRKRPKKKAA